MAVVPVLPGNGLVLLFVAVAEVRYARRSGDVHGSASDESFVDGVFCAFGPSPFADHPLPSLLGLQKIECLFEKISSRKRILLFIV